MFLTSMRADDRRLAAQELGLDKRCVNQREDTQAVIAMLVHSLFSVAPVGSAQLVLAQV